MSINPQPTPEQEPVQPTSESVLSSICGDVNWILESRHDEAFICSTDEAQLFRAEVYNNIEVDTVALSLPDHKRMQTETEGKVVFLNPFDIVIFRRPTPFARIVAPERFGDHEQFEVLPEWLITLHSTEHRSADVTVALFEDRLTYVGEENPWVTNDNSARELLHIVKDYAAHGDVMPVKAADVLLAVTDPNIEEDDDNEMTADIVNFLRRAATESSDYIDQDFDEDDGESRIA